MKLPALSIFLVLAITAADRPGKWLRYQATAYSMEGETASGKRTSEGRTVAADPVSIPLGSRIEVRRAGAYSGTYTVTDTGRKVVGRHIDFFIENRAEAKQFGKKMVQVRVVKRAAPEKK